MRPPVLQVPGSLSYFGAIPPIGPAYVAAALRRAGHAVTFIDGAGEALDRVRNTDSPIGTLQLCGLSPAEIVERIPADTQVVGLSHMFLHEWPVLRELAQRVKAHLPHALIVMGGENATSFWPWLLEQCDAVDVCVLGEGEQTAVALADRVAAGLSLDDLPGVALRVGGVARSNGLSARLAEPDTLAPPAWDLVPIHSYLKMADRHGVNRGRSLPIVATRGCPFSCTFCSSPGMWTTRYRAREPRSVVAEMAAMVERYGIQNFNFCDLTAIIKREWVLEFCDALIETGLDISWQFPSGTRTEALDAEVLQKMYRAGARNLTYAPESGSQRMLKRMKKRVKLPEMMKSLAAAHDAGLATSVSIIIGHPSETRGDVVDSMKLLAHFAREGADAASVMVFAPYPGSADFKELIESGRLEVCEDYLYSALVRSGRSSRIYNDNMSPPELIAWQWAGLVGFHALTYMYRPSRIAGLARGLITGREHNNIDQFLRTKLDQMATRLRSPTAEPQSP